MAGIRRTGVSSTAPQGQSEGRDGLGQGLTSRYKSFTSGSWEPTIIFMLLLVLVEIFAYGGLRYMFRSVHGG